MKKIFFVSFIVIILFPGITKSHTVLPANRDMNGTEYLVSLSQPTPEAIAQRETAWMTTELGLTKDQVTKVDAINLKYAEKMMAQFQGGPGGDFEAMQKQMAEINAQKRKELEPVLSAEQLKKYDEYLANRPAGGRGGFGPPPNQQ